VPLPADERSVRIGLVIGDADFTLNVSRNVASTSVSSLARGSPPQVAPIVTSEEAHVASVSPRPTMPRTENSHVTHSVADRSVATAATSAELWAERSAVLYAGS
jgi:hypothetical protein